MCHCFPAFVLESRIGIMSPLMPLKVLVMVSTMKYLNLFTFLFVVLLVNQVVAATFEIFNTADLLCPKIKADHF